LVGEPVVAVSLGVVVLGEHLALREPLSLLLPVAVVAMALAAVALSRGSVRTPITSAQGDSTLECLAPVH
jgi:hypothetical protein